MSNSFVGLLDDDGLDEIYHVTGLVLLGFDAYYPLCFEIDVAMTLLCLMLVTRARVLTRLQDIYNFLLFHAIILSILDVYMHLYVIFYDFWD